MSRESRHLALVPPPEAAAGASLSGRAEGPASTNFEENIEEMAKLAEAIPVAGTSSEAEVADLLADIDKTRAEVVTAMTRLHEQLEEVTDWRRMMARRPLAWMLGAAGLGVACALLLGPSRRAHGERQI